jgi:hypothetical protein
MEVLEHWFELSREAQETAALHALRNRDSDELAAFYQEFQEEVSRKKQIRKMWGPQSLKLHRRILTDAEIDSVVSEGPAAIERRLNTLLLRKPSYLAYVGRVAQKISRKRARVDEAQAISGLRTIVKHARLRQLHDTVASLEQTCKELRRAGHQTELLLCPALITRMHDCVLRFLSAEAIANLCLVSKDLYRLLGPRRTIFVPIYFREQLSPVTLVADSSLTVKEIKERFSLHNDFACRMYGFEGPILSDNVIITQKTPLRSFLFFK